MLVLEDLGGGLGVIEQLVYFLYLLPLHVLFSLDAPQQTGWGQQLDGVPEYGKQEMRATQYTHTLFHLHRTGSVLVHWPKFESFWAK